MEQDQDSGRDLKAVFPDVDRAAGALVHALASALALDFDEAQQLGCADQLLATTNFVLARRGSGGTEV